jgi:hypothetical protein
VNIAQLGAFVSGGDTATGESLLDLTKILILFFHSTVAGIILSYITFLLAKKFKTKPETDTETVLGASNIMFLCVGLTGIMILINNSLVRAFAIVAAIALVRFRVKLTSSSVNSSLLFGVMVGMSFGVQEIQLGWVVVGMYMVLLGIVLLNIKILAKPKSQHLVLAKLNREPNPSTLEGDNLVPTQGLNETFSSEGEFTPGLRTGISKTISTNKTQPNA